MTKLKRKIKELSEIIEETMNLIDEIEKLMIRIISLTGWIVILILMLKT